MAAEYPGELTAALAVEEEAVDGLGTGVVQGFISVTGVPDSLLNATSQEAAIQEALCEMSPCPDGLESVVVVQESTGTRMLLGGRGRQRRRRRLADLEAVQFEVSAVSGVEDDGEELTDSQQAASLFNMMADPDALSAVASVFDVGVEDVSFDDLRYYQGVEAPIVAEFELVASSSSSGLSVAVGTVVIVAMVIGVLVPLVGCILCCVKQHRREKKRREDAYYSRTASRKAQASAFYSAEDKNRAGSGEIESRGAPVGSSGQFSDPATRAPSLGQGFKPATRTPSITSTGEMHADEPDKFSHTNPMLSNNKRPIAPNVYFGEALKNHYQEDDANVEYNSSAEQLPTMSGDPPPVMAKSLLLSSQTAALARGRGSAASLPLQRSSAAAVAAAAVDAAARATAGAANFSSDQSAIILGESETKSKVSLASHDSSRHASAADYSVSREDKAVATAGNSSTAWDVENSYTRGGIDRDYARGGSGSSFGEAGGRRGAYSGSYDSGDFDQDSLTSASSVLTVRPLQPALAMQSNGSTASAVTPRSDSPTGGFAGFGGSPTGMSDGATVGGARTDISSEGVQERHNSARNSGDNSALYPDGSGTDEMQRHGSSGSPRLLEAGANETYYPRLEQHGLGCMSPRDDELEGEAFVDIGAASSRTTEAADADYGDADNAAGPLEINRRTTRSSGEASAVPAGRPTVAVSAISDKNIRASFTSPSPLEPPTRHLTESKTAEKELTVVTMVPIVTRYRPANGASQEMVTPREDLGAALSVKVPASPLQASAYGGEKSVPALIRKEYFRANGERGSLSLSRSFSSSELDYDRAQQKETHSGDGRRVLGATLTLRQHLADPSVPSRSYGRQDSYESSISSCASLSLSFKGDPSQWGNPIGEAKASATTEAAAVPVPAAAVPATALQKVDAPKPALENEPIETGLSTASAARAGLGLPTQYQNREEAMAANGGGTVAKKVVDRSFLVQFPVLSQNARRDGTSAEAIAARRARSFSSRSSGTLGSLSLSQSFSSEDLDYETDFTRRDEEDSENEDRGPAGVNMTTSQQQDTSREGVKGMAPAAAAAALKAEGPGADANGNEASILSVYHSLFAKPTRSNGAAQVDQSWD